MSYQIVFYLNCIYISFELQDLLVPLKAAYTCPKSHHLLHLYDAEVLPTCQTAMRRQLIPSIPACLRVHPQHKQAQHQPVPAPCQSSAATSGQRSSRPASTDRTETTINHWLKFLPPGGRDKPPSCSHHHLRAERGTIAPLLPLLLSTFNPLREEKRKEKVHSQSFTQVNQACSHIL